ncbi:cytochrome P450 [Cytidiella melzeri]|nr:cytochrome P450 [Cytidiella melzeri]
MLSTLSLVDILAGGCVVYILRKLLSQNQLCRLPPGPTGLPLIGNLLDLPAGQEWETYERWSKIYGDIMSIQVLGQPLIILSSPKVATDILDKRSTVYSDRPRFEMAGEIVGFAKSLALVNYGERWRTYRRMFKECIGSTRGALKRHMPLMEHSARDFLLRTLHEPEYLRDHLRRMASATIFSIAYGYKVQEGDDRFLNLADQVTDDFVEVCAPGAFLVDVFPWLVYAPSWFPGTGWQRKGQRFRRNLMISTDEPFEWTKTQMAIGAALPSFTLDGLEAGGPSADNEDYVKFAAMSLTTGGSDTVVSALCSFFLAMTLYPDVQKKVQAEIDAVVGNGRLPTVEQDWDYLPYVRAVCKEVLRWMPVAPMALPHRSTEDDVYENYYIPKGSIVLVNSWKILHDPEIYHNPTQFIPERFIAKPGYTPEADPASFAFGYGRRACPGSHVAETTIFLCAATSLAVFDVQPTVKDGKPVLPIPSSAPGVISHPLPFECDVAPRSAKAKALIKQVNEVE